MRILLLLFFSALNLFSYSQVLTNTVKGKVVDRDTKSPIAGARILILETQFMVISDVDGNFRLEKVPVGRWNFKVSFLGYEDVFLSQVAVGTGKELDLNIELQEAVQQLSTITVKAHKKDKPLNDMATVSVRSFNVEETQRFAASFNDPARMAVSFAGVNTSNDASNEIIVRGNSARGMLWRVEGIEIPSPNHFSNGEGGSGGGISILSSQVLGSSDFFTGAFPAEYGNALSGVFDIRFRKGNSQKRESALQVGILGLQVSFEGPFKKNYSGSYLINYRYSTLVLLNAIGLPIVDNALVPQFQDLSYNFFLPTKKWGNFSIWGLGGISKAGELAVKDSSVWERRSDRFQDNNFQWIGATGLTHTYLFKNQKSYLKTVVAVSGDQVRYRLDSLNQNYVPETAYQDQFYYRTQRTNIFLNHKFNSKHILRIGAIYSHYWYNILSKGLSLETNEFGTFVEENGQTGLIQAYVQWKWRLTDKMDLLSGAHYSRLLLNGNQVLEPRIGWQWRFKEGQSFNAGAGIHSRIEPVSVYMARIYDINGNFSQPNRNLNLTKAIHFVAGHDWSIAKQTRLKTEVYFQHLYDVPVDTTFGQVESLLNFSAGLVRNTFQNDGFGRNFGLEATLEKFFSDNYFFLLTGSLFQSQFSVDGNQWYNSRFNGNYMLNALGGYEWRFGANKKNTWSMNLRTIWRGGNRYTPINELASVQSGYEILEENQTFSKRVPDYFRIDFSSSLRFNYQKWAFSIALEIQNITNRLNVNRYFFDPYTQEIRTAFMFGIMPVFNFKFEF